MATPAPARETRNLNPAMLAEICPLSPGQRMAYFVDGLWRFTPSPTPLPRQRKVTSGYGQVRKIALDYVDGKFPGMSITAVAAEKRVAYESLKGAVWRVQHGKTVRAKAVA